MIQDWRRNWRIDFGFYYVQLAPWLSSNDVAEPDIRLAQLYANKIPKVGFATAMDLGDPTAPFGSIHPRNKQTVGMRLSAAARAITYGENVPYMGPDATDYKVLTPTQNAVVEVSFDPKSIGSGLLSKQATCDAGVPKVECAGYEIGTSKGWVAATAVITGNTVRVMANIGSETVVGVRYGNSNYPLASLFNREGFPAIPFAFPNPVKPV